MHVIHSNKQQTTNNQQPPTTNHQPQQQYPNPLLSISMDSESQPDNSWKLLGYWANNILGCR